jgi:hypothetical protein
MKNFTRIVISNTKADILLNLKLLLIWGAGVGSVINQITNYLHYNTINFSKYEIVLLICSIFAIAFDELKNVFNKTEELNVKKILNTINNTFYTFVNVITYSFIIPLLEIIWKFSHDVNNQNFNNEIIIRFTMFAIISIIGNFSKELIAELIKRI